MHQTKAASEPNLMHYKHVNLQTAINKLVYFKKDAKLEPIKSDSELPQEHSDIFNLLYTELWLISVVREAKGVDIKSGISSADRLFQNNFLFLSVLMYGKHLESPPFDHMQKRSFLFLRTYYFLPLALTAKSPSILV